MRSNMNEQRKMVLGANNPLPNLISPGEIKEAWDYSALLKVLKSLGMEKQITHLYDKS